MIWMIIIVWVVIVILHPFVNRFILSIIYQKLTESDDLEPV